MCDACRGAATRRTLRVFQCPGCKAYLSVDEAEPVEVGDEFDCPECELVSRFDEETVARWNARVN